jgi:hypothetical protein
MGISFYHRLFRNLMPLVTPLFFEAYDLQLRGVL